MNHQTTSTMLLKRAAHKGLRGLLVFAQITSALSATIATVAQPAALQPLLGAPLVANASTNQPTPSPVGNGVITVTKSVIGSTQSNFTVNIVGPSYPSGAAVPIVSGTQVITGLVNGVYTLTETSPGAGWTTTYTASGVSTSTNAVVTLTNANTAAAAAPGAISGMVFRDFNSDGNITANGIITDTGVQSVMVTAYDRNGNAVGSTTTNASGIYALTPTASGPWRLEFTALPAGYEPSRVSAGTQNGTSVQFVNSAPASNMNFGINHPSDYSQADPPVVVDWFVGGDNDNGTTPTGGVVTFPYAASIATPAYTTLSTRADVGSVWGLAWARQTRKLYAAAFLKRHSGLYEVGGVPLPGAIFQINPDTGAESLWADLASAPYNVNVGAVASNATRGLGAPTSPNQDGSVYYDIGIKSLGDIDLSEDEQTMYVMSLNDKTIYAIDVASKALLDSYPMTGITCTGGQFRPFGLKYYRGQLYAGGVCDASTSGLVADLRGRAYRLESGTFNQVLDFSLNYTNGSLYLNSGTCGATSNWHAWISSPTIPGTCVSTGERVYPQPVFSDIEFDTNGDMILGFLDRFGHQTGVDTYLPTSNTNERSIAAGEVFRACRTASGWALESAGDSVAGCLNSFSSGTIGNNNQGLGGGEFYWGLCFGGNNCTNNGSHVESANGGLALQPGRNELLATSMNPAGNAWAGGVMWLSNSTGAKNRGYHIYSNPLTGPAYLHKSHGVGDVELLVDPAPIEIGNRVWRDLNEDGVQDPGEPPISGVTVSMQTPTTTLTTNTNANGNYYFTVAPNTAYTITINPSQAVLSNHLLTTPDAGAISGSPTSNHAISDTRDSDATLVGVIPTIYYTTGDAGQNNHGLDFGFIPPATAAVMIANTAPPTLQVVKEIVGGSSNAAFPITVNGPGGFVSNTTVTAGTPTVFENIAAGVYTVTEGTLPAAPTGYQWIASPIYAPSDGSINVVAGTLAQIKITNILAQTSSPTATLILTKTVVGSSQSNYEITLIGPSYPAGQTFNIISGTNTITNLIPGVYTVTETSPGAGWVTTYTVGSVNSTTSAVVTAAGVITAAAVTPGAISGTVYRDFNSDGNITVNSTITDTGVQSVTVTAYDRNGNAVGSTTTNASGTYALTPTASGPWRIEFTNLPSGYEPSRVFTGTQNGTSVQFVNSAPAGNVNFGVLEPCDYCQSDPNIAIVAFARNTDLSSETAIKDVLNSTGTAFVPTDATDIDYGWADPVAFPAIPSTREVANVGEVGSTLGLAWDRNERRLFTGAYMRAFAGMKANALGNNFAEAAIYQVPYVNGAPGTPTVWLDLETLFGDGFAGVYATDPSFPTGSFGVMGNNPNRIGYTGLGEMKVSADGTEMYVVNLDKLEVLVIPIAHDGSAPTSASQIKRFPFPTADCPSGTWSYGRSYMTALGLGVYPPTGEVYATLTCTGPTVADLKGLIYAFDPADSTPSASDMVLTVTIPMNVVRPATDSNVSLWRAMVNRVWEPMTASGTYYGSAGGTDQSIQPWLGEVVFNLRPDGSYGMAVAERNRGYDLINHSFYVGGGVLYKVCNSGATGSPTWQLESNGACGTETSVVNWSFSPATRAGANTSSTNRFFKYVGIEGSMMFGTLANVPGSVEVMGPGFDNENVRATYGIAWLNALTGNRSRDNRLQGDGATAALNITNFGKSNAFGDVEVMCDLAPIEIGNRVWQDVNGNGVQDPGEPPIAGVVVSLQTVSGTITTTTNISGTYYFTREATTGAYTQTLRTNTAYVITIAPAQTALSGFSLTTPNAQAISGSASSNDAISDTRDSDAYLVSGVPSIYYTTGSAGQNNHGLDFGFSRPRPSVGLLITNTAPAFIPAQFGDRVWIESDSDGLANTGSITPVAGMLITATDGTSTYNTTTNAQGYYSFSVPAGTYTVTYGNMPAAYGPVLPSATPGSGTLSGNSGSYQQSGNPDQSHPQSTVVTVAATEGNWQVDFAFTPQKFDLGNRVWFDTNNDGVLDSGEQPVNGVTVQLRDSAGAVMSTTTTNAQGYYAFTNLMSGTYSVTVAASNFAPSGALAGYWNSSPTTAPSNTASDNDDDHGVNPATYAAYLSSGVSSGPISIGPGLPTSEDSGAPSTPNGDASNNLTIDFGFYKQEIGNTIWVDTNDNGLLDGAELPYAAGPITVTLVNNSGTVVSTTVTNNGLYTFTGVPSGTFVVSITVPAGFHSSTPTTNTVGVDTNDNGSASGAFIVSAPFTATPGTNVGSIASDNTDGTTVNPSIDFGLVPPPAQFGDRVWLESDTDGLASTGVITPVAGMVMTATDGANTYTTTTNAAGYYSFTVQAGTYTVTYGAVPVVYGIVLPSSTPGSGTLSGNSGSYAQSGNPDVSHPQDTTVTLAAGQSNWQVDFGFNPPQASIEVKKYTNGFDADTVTGPFIKPGDAITWTYVITNNGNVTLTNVTLVDSVEGTISCTPTTLAPGEGTTCEATGVATLGQYTNTAVVTGTPPVGPVVTSTNPSHYFGSDPKIVVKKYTNGFDADTLSDPRALLIPGAAVTWRYVVTNTGNVPLTMTLSDDRISLVGASCAPVSNGAQLAVGGTTTCTLVSTAQVTQTTNGIYTNTATVTGTVVLPPGTPTTPTLPGFPPLPPTQSPVTDTNPSHYEVLAQFGDRVWLESDTDGLAGTGTITPVAGMVMTATDGTNVYTTTTNAAGYYSFTVSAGTYTVTYGTVPPSYGTVLPSSTPGSGTLSGNSGSYAQSGNPDVSHPQDTSVSVAAGQSNWQVDFGFNPPQASIEVKKYTNGFDADTVTGPFVKPGDDITWTYVLTNNGNVTLTNVTLVDSAEGTISCTPTTLAPGEGTTCEATGVATLGQYTNTAVVTGTPPVGPVVTSTNPSHYFGSDPKIVVKKYTNGFDADTLSDPRALLIPGATVTWRYVVTNTGNVPLTMTLSDDRISLVGASCAPASNGQVLAVGGTTTCTLTSTAQVTQTTNGIYTNTATVTGTVVMPPGTPTTPTLPGFPPLPPTQPPVTDTNPSHYEVLAQFGDRVWLESDTDGLASTGVITPIAGMVMTATDGTNVYTTTTNAAGYYSFTVSAGTYTVTYGTVPPSYGIVVPSSTPGSNSTSGNAGSYQQSGNPDQSRPQNSTVTVAAGQANWTMDYAFNVKPPVYALGNLVFMDFVDNGVFDPIEDYGIDGVTMTLFADVNNDGVLTAADGAPISETVTAGGGFYRFNDLPAGHYIVIISNTLILEGGITTQFISSLADPLNLNDSATDPDDDVNHDDNGLQEQSSPGVPGRIVSKAITLGPGSEPVNDGDADPTTNLSVDFGVWDPSLGDFVWYDANRNGIYEPALGETGIPSVTLYLYRDNGSVPGAWDPADGISRTTTTNADGRYFFNFVVPGRYTVRIVPSNTLPSGPLNGLLITPVFDPTPDNNRNEFLDQNGFPDGLGGYVGGVITITNGAEPIDDGDLSQFTNLTYDFAFYQMQLGNQIWYEVDDDGLYEPGSGETPAPGITVTLLDDSGSLISTTVTNASGQYTFTNLVSGTYVLSATRPVGYRSSTPTTLNDGGNNTDHGTDSGPSTGSGFMVSVPFDMTPGGGAGTNESVITQTATTYNRNMDFGMVPPAQFGDRVWIESDSDGLASSGVITPVAGMVIAATDGTNTYTTTTNAAGYYSFTVPPGVYTVTYGSVPASYGYAVPSSTPGGSSTSGNQGSYQQSGNPDQSHTQATVVTVTPGQGNWHVDFGFNAPPSGIAVRKYTNGFDADTVSGPYLMVGDAVTWTYVVMNTGGTVMTVAAGDLTDDVIGAINASQFVLQPSQIQTFTRSGTATLGQYTNTAIVTGTPPSGVPTTSTNPSHYFGYTPGVVLKKYTNGFDADSVPGPVIKAGDAVTWTYIATNTGNIALQLAVGDLRDDVVGAINASALTLQPGETRTFTRTGTATSGQYTNTGLITGTPVLPPGTPITPELLGFPPAPPITTPVTSTNPSHYFGVDPKIVLKKFTNGYDADGLPLLCNGAPTFNNQACLPIGSVVTWTYVVTNTGNLPVDVAAGDLSDDKVGAINASAFSLAPGASTTLVKTGIASAGQYTNTGVVTGTPVLPPGAPTAPELPGFPPSQPVTNPITSTNPSHYFGDTAGLGDTVWEDLNHDGQQQPNEPGISGVLVSLQTPTTTLTMMTNSSGTYSFTYLVPGLPYIVSFGLPSQPPGSGTGYTWTLPTVGNPISDSNVIDPSSGSGLGNTSQVVLGPNEFNPTIDAGVWRPASLGDYVWEDINHDGQQNDGNTGVNGVLVTLYSNGTPVSQTQTYNFAGLDGYYTFTNLISDTYSVTFQAPTGYQFTLADVNPDNTDSDANPVTGGTSNYVLNAGQSIPTVDAGLWRPASLGDYVWEDLNHDGQQNDPSTGSGQVTGLNGVAVALLDASGNVVSTTNTYQGGPSNANGYYTFTNLISGTYSVSFTLPSGYQWTTGNTGNDTTDSDGTPQPPVEGVGIAVTQQYVLNAGESNPTVDQGVWRPATLGDVVWYDQNHDGVQQPGEPGVPGVQVTLQTPTGTLTTQTDSTGAYSFTNLISGVPFTVTFGQPSTGYTFTLPTVGGPINDSNVLNPSGVTAPVILQPGENNPTIDAGVWVPLSLGNYVWIDTDNNGLANEANTSVPSVSVVLYTDNGDGVLGVGDTQVATTTTDATGHYTFTNLISGTYLVQLPQSNFASGPLVNYQSSTGNGVATTNNNINNDDDGEPAGALGVTSRPVTLTPFLEPLNDDTDDSLTPNSNSNYSVDFGFFQMAAIGDRVWYDTNANGVQDSGGPTAEITGVPGVQVTLFGPTNTVIATTTTDANGYYSFTNLLPGDYSVSFALPSGYTRSPSTPNGASDPTDSDADGITGRTDTTTLVSGENDPTWDAGIYQTASLGDRVWEDLNRNGVQDGGEPGVMSVTVTLWSNGVPISTTQTDGTGFYGFSALTPTVSYSVSFGLPPGYVFTLPDVGTDGTDSDADPVTGGTPVLTLQPNESNPTIDAGLWRPAGIGDRVWLDNDRDGVQIMTDTGVSGVTVNLYQNGSVISNTTTDVQGYYSFTGLIPGTYSLTFGSPTGYARTPQDALGNGLDAQDSDTTLVTGQTITTTLDSNEYDPTWDMGLFQLASLGSLVWEDLNHDGKQDPNEPGVPGTTVILYDVNNTPVATTTTDANGNYSFTNLIPATYTVGFVQPPNYLFTLPGSNPSGNDPNDSNANPSTGRTPPVLLVPGENNPTIDAGLWRPASLGDYVWDDTNHNGQQDASEQGVNGVVVTLLNANGVVISSTQTYNFNGQNGYYTFTNLISNTYVVSFALPTGYQWTTGNSGSDVIDSDGVVSSPMSAVVATQPIVLNAGESNPTVDQGVWKPASLGDRVWWDYDHNGQQATQTDVGVPGITVRLLDASGSVISTTVTDSTGFYTFSNLISNTYRVAFDLSQLPAGSKVTLPNVSGNGKDLFDSDADVVTGRTQLITLVEGENDPSWDLGIWLPAGLGDTVWEDKNHDGVQEPNEPGVPGVTVILYDSTGQVVSTTTTGASGYYTFSELVPMTYTVVFVPPGAYTLTTPFVGDPGTDSNADPTTGSTPPIVLAPGQFNPTVDAGLWIPASLGNYVWRDDNADIGSIGDGIQNEPASNGLNGVTVNLLNASGTVIATQMTHDDPHGNPGYYTFTNLIPSDYVVQFVLPPGTIFTEADASTDNKDSDANTATGKTVLITLESGENDPTWDAGIIVLAGLGNYVWSDNDRNGIQDANEPAVPGVVVKLYDDDGSVISTTMTDVNGFYVFTGLIPGTYSVGFTAPNGFMFTTQGSTPTSDTDSNANPQTGRAQPVVLAPGEYNPTIDAGLIPLASLGDFVWNDQDRNGHQDPGEPDVPGVTVTLKNGDGQVVATTTTNASGAYSFTNLIPGTYVVVFTIPQGYTFTKPNVGGDGTDSDAVPQANVLVGVVPPVTLLPGENNSTIDAGVWVPARLGDFVWYDVNRNGIQDAGEVGVKGVTVTLYQRGNVLSTTVTTADGRYLFDNLVPGDYYVVFTLPNGFTFTLQNSGTAQSDSNADSLTGQSATTTIDPGEDDRTWDAGIWLPLPALNIRKTVQTGTAAVKQGDLVSYTIVVSNSGPGIANTVVITDPLPSDLLYEAGSAKPAAIYANKTLTWTKATLQPGERYTMTFAARVQASSSPTATQIVNLAYTSATGPTNVPVQIATPPLQADDQANVQRAPTAITLASFTARWVTNTVAVQWVTGEEINSFGFVLYRAQVNDLGAAVKLNDVLIPARGSNGGAGYSFVDTSVDTSRSDIVYYYWLQEVETNGKINVYGPVKTERETPTKPTKYLVFLPMISKSK